MADRLNELVTGELHLVEGVARLLLGVPGASTPVEATDPEVAALVVHGVDSLQ